MALSHTTHSIRGIAAIFDEQGRSVGRSKRSPSPLGGYDYVITANDETQVYSGNRMSEGLAALEKHLEGR
jgi:hypothetical protein